ncbi:hypothetical protein D9Q98_000136 [Chlorella vulgaris]|uniref:Lon N-terminal domain-containing protein n=1 Tax=Chlorella vulgaris TaxID=3077 RepID=A0A9D4TXT0_CHLVU|nr:hypothetical protein D9Q98_000136 [Chlorella vulgaris]
MSWARQATVRRSPVSCHQTHLRQAPNGGGNHPTSTHNHKHGRRSVARQAQGGEGGSSDADLRRLLNELYFAPSAPKDEDAAEPPSPATLSAADGPLLLRDLPLWRVQWAALPGSREALHVHVPHYTSMFERLWREPGPWRFGHIMLPEGSKNLGNPEFALTPDTKAPLVGTLMEVAEAVRFGDGRLLILAVGIARFRVLRPTQDVPYSRADVELLLDAEEQQSFEQLAVQALDSVRGGLEGEVPMSTLMAAVLDAAQAAAAAYGAAWVEYELSDMRAECGEEPRVIDGSRTEQAQLMGRRLAAIAGNEVMQLPFWDVLASTAQAAGQPTAGPGALADQGPAAAAGTVRLLEEAAAHLRPRLRRMEAEAQVLATRAAVSRVAHHLDLRQPKEGEEEAAVPPPPPPSRPVLNTTSERGIAWQAPDEVLDASECLSEEPDSLAVTLRLEAAVWREVAAIHKLASKLRERLAPLPDGLLCLRPWQPGTGAVPAAADASAADAAAASKEAAADAQHGPGAHPDYPALRRAQRLSFAVTSLLGNVTSEGRQAYVEAGSISARLRLGLAALRLNRHVLAAAVALKGLD